MHQIFKKIKIELFDKPIDLIYKICRKIILFRCQYSMCTSCMVYSWCSTKKERKRERKRQRKTEKRKIRGPVPTCCVACLPCVGCTNIFFVYFLFLSLSLHEDIVMVVLLCLCFMFVKRLKGF